MASHTGSFWRAIRASGLIFREVVGWALLLLGLNVFRYCFRYLDQALVTEGFISAIIGVMLFRGGLQLVKVAVAARALRSEASGGKPVVSTF